MLLWTVILTIYFEIMTTVVSLRHYPLSRLGAVLNSNISYVYLDLCYKLYNLNIRCKFDVLLCLFSYSQILIWIAGDLGTKKRQRSPRQIQKGIRELFLLTRLIGWSLAFYFVINIVRSDMLGHLVSFSNDCQFSMWWLQMPLKASERDAYEFFSKAGKVSCL